MDFFHWTHSAALLHPQLLKSVGLESCDAEPHRFRTLRMWGLTIKLSTRCLTVQRVDAPNPQLFKGQLLLDCSLPCLLPFYSLLMLFSSLFSHPLWEFSSSVEHTYPLILFSVHFFTSVILILNTFFSGSPKCAIFTYKNMEAFHEFAHHCKFCVVLVLVYVLLKWALDFTPGGLPSSLFPLVG